MTILNCSATKCIYNDNKLCSRGDIEITGDNAQRSTSTAKHRNAPTTTNVNVPPPPLM